MWSDCYTRLIDFFSFPCIFNASNLGGAVEFTVKKTSECTTIRITGELDSLTVPDLREPITRIAADDTEKQVVLDLSELHTIDAYGAGLIRNLFRAQQKKEGKLRVQGVQGQPLQILQVLHLHSLLGLNQDEK